jgi:hypothetical protein
VRVQLPALMAQEFPEVRSRVKLLPNGPPVPYPVQFRVMGPDPKVLRERADEVKEAMRQSPNTRGVNDNWNESVKVLRMEVDQAKARALGVTSQSIAQASRTTLNGTSVGQYREGDKLIDIVLRQPLDERNAISDLGNGYLPTTSGKAIPLTQIAKPVFTWEPGVMWREGRNYAITVQSDIVEGLQGATVTQELLPKLKALEARWPQGYRIQVAGAVEESSKGSSSIAAGVPVMLFITFTLLMLQLQSFLARDAGVPDRPSGNRRRRRRPAAAEPSLRVRGAAGRDRPDGHDPAQLGDPDRPDRAGPSPGCSHLERDRRSGGAPLAPHRAHRRGRGPGHDPPVALGVLGPHGGRDHGRTDRRHRADAAGAARHVRGVVPGQARGFFPGPPAAQAGARVTVKIAC